MPKTGRPAYGLELVPLKRAEAQAFVNRVHRHHGAPIGDLFRVGAQLHGELVAVGMAGRPIARAYDDGRTVEIVRVAADGTPNATSIIYSALTRSAWALGYTRVITYTEDGESGASLRGAGWRVIAQRTARRGWNTPSRPRGDETYKSVSRTLWEAAGSA